MARVLTEGFEETLAVGGMARPALRGGYKRIHRFGAPRFVREFRYQREGWNLMRHR